MLENTGAPVQDFQILCSLDGELFQPVALKTTDDFPRISYQVSSYSNIISTSSGLNQIIIILQIIKVLRLHTDAQFEVFPFSATIFSKPLELTAEVLFT